jgi:subtilisin-like proprotein convertase family protein
MKKFFTLILVFAFALIASFSRAQTFTWSGNVPIYDLQTDTVPILVSGLPAVIDTNFGIAHVCMNITHTYDADLLIKIVSPDGTTITLIQNTGGGGDNFLGTCVGVDGTLFSNASAPYAGLFQPVGDLSSLNNGQNPNGTWLFIVKDQANADTGSIHSASIEFTNNPPHFKNTGGSGSGPTGTYLCATCACPGGASDCDLLPDMTSSAKEIMVNHTETPGFLYISNATPNIGYGPIEIYGIDSCYCGTTNVPCGTTCPGGDEIKHVIKQRIYHKVAGNDTLTYYDRFAGLMTFHPTHGHLHVDDWANYTLRTPTSNPDATTWPIIATGTKQSFCLVNLGLCNNNPGECLDNNGNTILTVPNQNVGFHTGCGLTQGIYPGNYDVYSISLNDPIPLVNVCNGTYYIVSITDPQNNFLESDETNNWVAVPITLTQQSVAPTISAAGPTTICPGDSVTLTASIASNYLWSTGDTTQSIVVHNPGSYTVSTDCGSSVSTSSAIVVNITNLNLAVTANPPAPACFGEPVQLDVTTASTGTQEIPATFSNNQAYFIPDNNVTGVSSPIAVSGIDPATLSANTIVSVSLNLTHTYDGDLAISLIAPSGNSIYLSNRRGGSGNDFINTLFTMSASTLISSGSPPFSGSYKPDGNFSALTGNINGNWILRVQDLAGADTGRIRNWSLTILNEVPETFTYLWSSTPPGFSSGLANPVVNPAVSTTYLATVTSDLSGCSDSQTVVVNVPQEVSVTSVSPGHAQAGASILIEGSGFNSVTGVSFGGNAAGSFTVLNPGQVQAVVPNSLPGTVSLCVQANGTCDYCSPFLIDSSDSLNVDVKVFIEGFYLGGGQMQAAIDPVNYPGICDTIVLGLHDASAPHTLVFEKKNIISTSGEGSFYLPVVLDGGSYYLSIRHRNSIETWSSSPVVISNNMIYDFTAASNKSYGNNLSDLGDGNYAMYSGDISDALTAAVGVQDGIIESQDYGDLENAIISILQGYVYEDLTGDGIVESSDYSLLENNVTFIITSQKP